MSAFNETTTETNENQVVPVPYQVCAGDIHCDSVNSIHYNKREVDDIVYIGMCDLYEKVIPQVNMTEELFDQMTEAGIQPPEAHMPYHTTISDQSYVYTSVYEHNKFEVMIMEQNHESHGRQMYVRFTIEPIHEPTVESDRECDKIEKRVLDVIYTKVNNHFLFLRNQDWMKTQEKDENSKRGYDDLY